MRSVDIVQPDQHYWQLEAVCKCSHHTFSGRFRCCVRIRWVHTRVFLEVVRIHSNLAVHL